MQAQEMPAQAAAVGPVLAGRSFYMSDLLPFHKALVKVIGEAVNQAELLLIADLIKSTRITSGHDEIVEAYTKRVEEVLGIIKDDFDAGYFDVIFSLMEKKRVVEKENEDMVSGIDLDDLQSRCEKLLSVLKDRHPGLYVWNQTLKQLLMGLNRIISLAFVMVKNKV